MRGLSKGQAQRLALARTLLHDPELLILDEPAAGLDPKARVEFKNLVRLLRAQGKTLLISSHILSELGEMCDSLLFIHDGRIVHHGTAESLRRGHASDAAGARVRVKITVAGDPAPLLEWLTVHPGWKPEGALPDGARAEFSGTEPAALAEQLRRMVTDGLAIAGFQVEERLLEDVFIDLLKNVSNGGGAGATMPPPPPPLPAAHPLPTSPSTR
jgi:ABC-2 type transport system ATP-binding protein